MCTEFNLKIDESTELLDIRTFDNYDALNFYSALILSAALIVEAFILLRPEKTVKEDNVINAIIVNEDSLIVQII